jgi:glycosyltransferase involved in cell wall biosynthesis
VLAQTHKNWEWHLYENGSTDGGKTWDIIRKYAETDERIKPYRYIDNNQRNTYLFLAREANLTEHKNDYFTYICADDTWEPDYMSDMIAFQKENRLDIASCVSKFTNSESGEILNRFFLEENIICSSPQDYSDKFSELYPFYRELWGHLIPFSVLRKLSFFNYLEAYKKEVFSFLDLMMNLLAKTECVGILAKPLHNYYVSKTNLVSRPQLKTSRIVHFGTLCGKLRMPLLSKCGYISADNERFIQARHVKTITDYLSTVFSVDNEIEKLMFIIKVIRLKNTKETFESGLVPSELKANFCDKISVWLKTAMAEKRFYKKGVIGDKAGDLEVFASQGTDNLNYRVYDLDSIASKQGDFAKPLIGYVFELEQFINKYRSID